MCIGTCSTLPREISVKYRGGLFYPSTGVVKVIRISESLFKQHVGGNNFREPKITSKHGIKTIVKYHTRKEVPNINVFASLDNHKFENYVINEDLHSTQLSLAIAEQ